MRIEPNRIKTFVVILSLLLVLQASNSFAQLVPEVAEFGYADTIFVNGKVVSMDDESRSTTVGNIYEAIAVKGDKIMKLGTTAQVRALAGPDTLVLDLKGRTLIPGIIEPHSHMYGRAVQLLDRLGFKYPPEGVLFTSATADPNSLEKTQAIMRDAIKEAVEKVDPGDWIVLSLGRHADEAPQQLRLWQMTRRLTNRKTMDLWSPENPVLMRPGLRGNVNSKALEVLKEFFPGYAASIHETMHGDVIGEDIADIGWVGSQEMSVITWELFLEKLPLNTLAQAIKIISEEAATKGITTFSSRIQFPKIMSGYATLAGLGQMPIRLSAHYEIHRLPTDPQQTRQIYRRTGVLQGIGDDYLWIDGVASERWDSLYPESCTGPDTIAPPHIKAREVCPVPGELPWDTLQNAAAAGWRLAGVHMCGSESARAFFTMIDRAREVNGWSMQQVRDLRMTGEHCNLIGKSPEIIQQLKDYGIILSCGPDIVGESPAWVKDYGEQIQPFILPFKTWIDAGVKLVGQHYGSTPPFNKLWQAVTRQFDGVVWQPEERIDRVHALKMWTSWASEYILKQDKLGTLVAGKFADLVVMDRDYFTVPVDDILKIRTPMTMVGGKIIQLQESLASDFGIEPVGPVYDFSDEDVAAQFLRDRRGN
ncbi:MAG: amidohydrolase family protein [Acidobacteria bacterium]|nr:amidohydrolase family protein [Acidobacteriota bacterium]